METTTMLPWGSAGQPEGAARTDADPSTGLRLPRPRAATPEPAPAMSTVRVLVADPDPESRHALRNALTTSDADTVDEVADELELTRRVSDGRGGDLLLISLAFGSSAAGLIAAARSDGWTRVIALSPQGEIGAVIDAVGAGAHGILLGRRSGPPPAHVPTTINDLSAREIEVLNLVADGRSNKWIGEQLSLSALTVKSHLARIGRKLGTGDRAHMVALALRAGVIS